MKSEICKALQKRAKSNSFVTDNALKAQFCFTFSNYKKKILDHANMT
jgi:hypothetical protein